MSEKKKILCSGTILLSNNEIDCYVTEDRVRVLSGRQMQTALTLVKPDTITSRQPGSRLTRFLQYKNINAFIFKDLEVDHFQPIICQKGNAVIHGYRAEILADICDGMLDARKASVVGKYTNDFIYHRLSTRCIKRTSKT